MFDDIGFTGVLPDILEKSGDLCGDNQDREQKISFAPCPIPNEHSERKTNEDNSDESIQQEDSPLDRKGAAEFCESPLNESEECSMNPGDYRLEEPVGYGSSAIVYLATYLPTQSRVAIKIIELDRFEKNQIDALRREIQVMRLCCHPNLLGVLVSFVQESQLWIVTPFLAVGSCLDLLRIPEHRSGIMNEVVIATILLQALQGLAYLHQNGHIHRDIKAGNLLVDSDGQVQLADFGVSASLLDPTEGREASRLRKTFVGTPCWMAPEVMEMTKGYDAKADIWSFGITAFELANGHAPYSKLPAMKVIFVTLSNDAPKFNRHRSKITFSKSFKDLIHQCLQKDPAKRPTAEALLRHPFFKQAKKKGYLVSELIAAVPPIQQRARINTAKMHERRAATQKPMSSNLKNEAIPEEDWNFSSAEGTIIGDEDDEGEEVDGEEEGEEGDLEPCRTQWTNTCADKRGRFVVEPGSQLGSPTTGPSTTTDENCQSTIQSGAHDIDAPCAEIRRGRFSVNPTGTAGADISPHSTSLSPASMVEAEEEGRKSRFEVVHHQQDQTTPRSRVGSNPQNSSNASAMADLHRPSASTSTAINASAHHVHPERHQHLHGEFAAFASSSVPGNYPQSAYWHQPTGSALIDHLLHQNDLMRHHLLELRARWSSFYGHANPMAPPPFEYMYGGPTSPQLSPVPSANASQSELNYSGHQSRSLQPHQDLHCDQRPRQQSTESELERQMAQLRFENDQLRRRLL